MNIRDRKIFYALMTLIGLMGILTSCHREEIPNDTPQQSETPISFTPTSDWPTLTKATIIGNGNGNVEGEVDYRDCQFAVWGLFHESEQMIFDGTDVWYDNDSWTYESEFYDEPTRYWSIGNYSFAAVMPAGVLDVDEDGVSWDPDPDSPVTTIEFKTPFDLSTSQTDILIALSEDAYTTADMNSADEKSVTLNFEHQLALVNFTIENALTPTSGSTSELTITGIEVYGNHKSASSWSGRWSLSSKSDENSTYFSAENLAISCSNGEDSAYLISNLLVFPEECSLYVEVTYKETLDGVGTEVSITKTTSAPIECNWEAGKQYTYPLQITTSDLIYLAPIVEDWEDKNIDHVFN